jgi:hypothetical protein
LSPVTTRFRKFGSVPSCSSISANILIWHLFDHHSHFLELPSLHTLFSC